MPSGVDENRAFASMFGPPGLGVCAAGDPPELDRGEMAARIERRDVVQLAECDEVVGPAGLVLAALAGADQDALT